MSADSIPKRIEAAAQGATIGRSSRRGDGGQDLTSEAYDALQAEVHADIQELLASQRLLKGALPPEVSEQWLREQRAHYEGFADIFEAMATRIADPHYPYISRSPPRKRCAQEVSRAARNLAQYFESVWRDNQRYSITRTAGKLNTLIITLENLDST